MLSKELILRLFESLNQKLKSKEISGEVGIVGGAAMCLVYNARCNTKDVDAIFQPSTEIRNLSKEIAHEENVAEDWLNDGVKGFLSSVKPTQQFLLSLSNLKVWTPEPEYMLAMKAMAARFDSHDAEDLKCLINHLNLKSPAEVFKILAKYYPSGKILVKTQYFVEDLFE